MIADAIQARLNELVTVYVHDVDKTPPGAYVVIYPATGHLGQRTYAATSTAMADDVRVMCVASSVDAVLRLCDAVRGLLTGWRPSDDPAQGFLREIDSGPVIDTRTETVVRHSLTLVYRAHTTRKAPIT